MRLITVAYGCLTEHLVAMTTKRQPLRPLRAPHSASGVRSMKRDGRSNVERLPQIQDASKTVSHNINNKTSVLASSSSSSLSTAGLLRKQNNDQLANRFSRLTIQNTAHRRKLSYRPGSDPLNLEGIAGFIRSGLAKHIVVMTGAGISTPSGIQDFRSPGTGLYDNLQKYNIPYPEAIFDLDYFHQNPRPFFVLAKELWPNGKYRPNYVHYFLRLLHDKGLLHRLYTQNIDGLERSAGVPPAKLVEAHGTFRSASCTRCESSHPAEHVKSAIFSDKIPRCVDPKCRGYVKPDIVFFGEDLPQRFFLYTKDFHEADLLIVLGTSLEVEPFAGIVNAVRFNVPRLLFNRDLVGPFRSKSRRGDVAAAGDITEQVKHFVDLLGWTDDLENLIEESEKSKQVSDLRIPGTQNANSSTKETAANEAEATEKGNRESASAVPCAADVNNKETNTSPVSKSENKLNQSNVENVAKNNSNGRSNILNKEKVTQKSKTVNSGSNSSSSGDSTSSSSSSSDESSR